ncbi:hypothetical protein AF332_10140 [Sporosarcina globispora]|uniref:Uncharacterized protein n=1 Tax=Sporosarcina globispora TaxID=1459 RepID=A0A0M0GC71_SPOGL|nr:hypothetical protein AF332_10140 [Sporosarcina globispora]
MSGKIEFFKIGIDGFLQAYYNHIYTFKILYSKSYEETLLSLISLFKESQWMVGTGTKIR